MHHPTAVTGPPNPVQRAQPVELPPQLRHGLRIHSAGAPAAVATADAAANAAADDDELPRPVPRNLIQFVAPPSLNYDMESLGGGKFSE